MLVPEALIFLLSCLHLLFGPILLLGPNQSLDGQRAAAITAQQRGTGRNAELGSSLLSPKEQGSLHTLSAATAKWPRMLGGQLSPSPSLVRTQVALGPGQRVQVAMVTVTSSPASSSPAQVASAAHCIMQQGCIWGHHPRPTQGKAEGREGSR